MPVPGDVEGAAKERAIGTEVGVVVTAVVEGREAEFSETGRRATSVVCTTPWTTTRVPGGGNCREGVGAS